MMNEEKTRGRSQSRHEISVFEAARVRVTEVEWKATWSRERRKQWESGDQVFHVSSLDRRKAAKPTQRAALTLTPSLSLLISLTMRRRMSEVMGYRIALAPSPFPPRMMRSRCGSLSAVIDIPVSTW